MFILSTPPKRQQKAKTNMIMGVGILLLLLISVVLVIMLSGKDKMNPVIASIYDTVYRELYLIWGIQYDNHRLAEVLTHVS